MSNQVKQLAYISQATDDLNHSELVAILSQSRSNNERDGITGFLMYCERNFFQVIEGNKTAIDALWLRLNQDRRHFALNQLLYRNIPEPEFAGWSMAFRCYDKAEDVPLEGYCQFFDGLYSGNQDKITGLKRPDESEMGKMITHMRSCFLGGVSTAS